MMDEILINQPYFWQWFCLIAGIFVASVGALGLAYWNEVCKEKKLLKEYYRGDDKQRPF